MNIYCITHKPLKEIEKLGLTPAGVGTANFPSISHASKPLVTVSNSLNGM